MQSVDLPSPAEILEIEASRCFEGGALTQARTLLERALRVHVGAMRHADEARCAQRVGYLCFQQREHEVALRHYARAAELNEFLGDLPGAAVSWGHIAEVHQFVGQHDHALRAHERALSFLRRCGHLKDIGVMLNNMAVSYREKGLRNEAMACHVRALEIRREFNDFEGLASSLHNLGVLQGDAGEFTLACSTLEEARDLRITLKDVAGQACTELRLGILHEEQGRTSQAIACYSLGYTLARQAGSTDNEAASLINLSGLLIGQRRAHEAMPLLDRAEELFLQDSNPPGTATVLYHRGLALSALDRPADAIDALQRAATIRRDCGDRSSNLSALLSVLGALQARQQSDASALLALREALHLQLEHDEHACAAATAALLSRVCDQMGQTNEAVEYRDRALQLQRLIPQKECPRPQHRPVSERMPAAGLH